MEAETKDTNQLAEMLQKIPDKERETILHMVKGIELVNSCKEAETKISLERTVRDSAM